MARYHLSAPVHAENETPFGRLEADFPAGDVVAEDEAHDALLAWLVDLDLAVKADDSDTAASAQPPVAAAASVPEPTSEPAPDTTPVDDHQEVAD